MKKPVIAISGQCDPKPNLPIDISIYGATNHNCDRLVRHGAVPLVVPFIDHADIPRIISMCDGLLMTGGADVDPALYGEETEPFCAAIQKDRDAADLALFKEAVKQKKPIMCICRGLQIANVYFGGSLYQDIKIQLGDMINHPNYVDWRNEKAHKVEVEEGTPLFELFGEKEFYVNSLHHQGIKTLGKGVVPMAKAEDGLVESWYYSGDCWIRAYQWHPEMQTDNSHNIKIFEDFIKTCAENAAK